MKSLNIGELIEFAPLKRVRKKLLGTKRLVSELLCYEPGQSTPTHQHPQQDECFFVLEGQGTLTVDGESKTIRAMDMILVPPQTPHSLAADGGCRMILVFFKSPAATVALPTAGE
jgi:quercetin dioxygenase-like cupin family protein